MRRREFVGGLVTAVAWPVAASAQQSSMPVVAFLTVRSVDEDVGLIAAFRQSLSEAGYTVGRNVAIEFSRAEGHNDRLPALAADLVRREVNVIVVAGGGTPAAVAAKQATTTIPVIFHVGVDPVAAGLVASLGRPGGNVTGVSNLSAEVVTKRLEFLSELVPTARVVALLVNPTNAQFTAFEKRELQNAVRLRGLDVHIVDGGTEPEIDAAFPLLLQRGVGALMVSADSYLVSRRDQMVALAARHRIPVMYSQSEAVKAGGLVSYGYNNEETYRLIGAYAARILKGANPADLPVQQPTKFELVINLKTAKALGMELPPKLLAIAHEVIE
jgi:putative tryptophan/tyrosine transport system substrate-binding protein